MWYLCYIAAFFFHFASMLLAFNEDFRKSNYFFYISLSLSFCNSVFWLNLVKLLNNNEKIIVHSAYWDFMALIIYLIFPMLLFKFKFNNFQFLGLFLVILGFFTIKIFQTN